MPHGTQNGWIGVDLDGTLAEYHGWRGPGDIGAPIPAMIDRVKRWLTEGRDVRILTARVSPLLDSEHELYDQAIEAHRAIADWCIKHIGQSLPITCVKDLAMIELWDDRAVQVAGNTGQPVAGSTSRIEDLPDPSIPNLDYAVYSGSEKIDLGPKQIACFCESEHQARHMASFWAPYGYYEKLSIKPNASSSASDAFAKIRGMLCPDCGPADYDGITAAVADLHFRMYGFEK